MNSSESPKLIEPGVKYFLNETLKHCNEFKSEHYNLLYNLGFFFLFIFIIGTILLIKFKGKLTPYEKEMKEREKQQYILSKIRNYQDTKRRTQQGLITNLPPWDLDGLSNNTSSPF